MDRVSHTVSRLFAAVLFAALLLAPGSVPAVEWEPYGFIRFDAHYDDSRMQDHQFPMWVLSEDERAGPKDNSDANVHPRLTRLGSRFTGFDVGPDWKLRGVIEIDFQNGGSESREIIRMRHGYVEIARGDWRLLAGQTWDLMSPLFPAVNNDGMMWNAGNLGDRRPQARLTWAPAVAGGELQIAVAAGQTGAVDNQDLDGDGAIDGIDAAEPNWQTRAGFARALPNGGKVQCGAWGTYAKEETVHPVAGERTFETWAGGVDLKLWPVSRFGIEGEIWAGENLSDVRGGIAQGVNPLTGNEVAAQGGWAQLVLDAGGGVTLLAGYSLDDPDDEDVPTLEEVSCKKPGISSTGRTRNEVMWGMVRYRPWQPLVLAGEYQYWTTEFAGLDEGDDNRVDVHVTLLF